MAQSVYSGLQGHGKSYEVVRGVVVPNVAKGRRVVTNVAGLKYGAICEYAIAHYGSDPDKLGEIVHVENDDVTKDNFYPVERTDALYKRFLVGLESRDPEAFALLGEEEKLAAWDAQFIVQPGDVIVLDECWRWYVVGEPLRKDHLTFFRMHRHFIHRVTGQACDIVLIVQALEDLQRKVKATVEKSFLMQKHKDLGMPDRYVVNIYSGNRQTKTALIESTQCKYDPAIFALYSSYSQANKGAATPKEEQADNRGNFMKNWRIRYGLPLAVVLILAGLYGAFRFFNPANHTKKVEVVADEKGVDSRPASAVAVPSAPKVFGVDDVWRVVGYAEKGNSLVFMLADSSNRIRYVADPPAVRFSPLNVEFALPSGVVVASWSGAPVRSAAAGAGSERGTVVAPSVMPELP